MSHHAFDDEVDGLYYCAKCGIWDGASAVGSCSGVRRAVPALTAEQREALTYVRDMVRRNPIEAFQDAISKRHTAMVRTAVETIDALLAAPERTT